MSPVQTVSRRAKAFVTAAEMTSTPANANSSSSLREAVESRDTPHPGLLPQGEGEHIELSQMTLCGEFLAALENTSLSPRQKVGVRGKSSPTESFRLRPHLINRHPLPTDEMGSGIQQEI